MLSKSRDGASLASEEGPRFGHTIASLAETELPMVPFLDILPAGGLIRLTNPLIGEMVGVSRSARSGFRFPSRGGQPNIPADAPRGLGRCRTSCGSEETRGPRGRRGPNEDVPAM